MLSDQDPAELDLIRVIIAAYHTTRLSPSSAEAHILSKPSVRKSLDRYREEGRQSAGERVKALEEALKPFAILLTDVWRDGEPFTSYFDVSAIRAAWDALHPPQAAPAEQKDGAS